MTILDWAIVAIFLVSWITAFMNGFLVEVFSIAGWLAGIAVAGMYFMQVERWLLPFVHSRPAAEAASFLAIVIGVVIVAGIVGRALRWLLQRVGLGWADRLLGLLVGAVKGSLAVTVIAMVATAFFPHAEWVSNSRLLPYFAGSARVGSDLVPGQLGERMRHGVFSLGRKAATSSDGGGMVTF